MKHRRSANIPCSTAHTFLVSMASLLSLSFLVLFIGLSRSSPRHPNIREACKATRFSELCEKSLSKSPSLPPRASAMEVIQASVSVSSQNLRTARSMVNDILRASAGNLNRTNAAKTCLEVLRNSDYRISSTLRALPRGRLTDARSWMSAALAYQYDCWSGLKYVNGTRQVSKTMSFFESVIASSSNALSMMAAYAVSGNDVASWAQPRTERVGFWEVENGSGDELGFNGGVPPGLSANVTVCKEEGKRCFRTVQKAVDAAPANLTAGKFVIHIKAGVYKETVRVPLEKTNLVFLGDGMGKTIITGSANVGQPGMSTYNSATVGVVGDGFMAEGLTIENTAGPDAHQAVAFRSDSDRSVLQNCEFTGNQDTLYAHSLRQFYRSCRITGNVDFIFGNAAALFQNCTILVAPRQLHPEKGENNAITAHGRTDPAQRTGFVFQGCLVNGTAEYVRLYLVRPAKHRNYLGRPWKEFSRSVFIRCVMEALIAPEGWMPWDKDFALETLYYGEFGNSGPGANLTGRVRWSSRVPREHAGSYSVRNFIQGDEWIPPLFPGSV